MTHVETMPATTLRMTTPHAAGWETRRATAVPPPKPDPDVQRLAAGLRLSYGNAKLLKALSFGVPVTDDLALWCLGSIKTDLAHIVSRMRCANPAIDIEYSLRDRGYIIRDERDLAALRRIMGEA